MANTNTGFESKRFPDILADVENDKLIRYGDGINLEASTPDNMEDNLLSEALSQLWNRAQQAYDIFHPVGSINDNLKTLTGINGLDHNFGRATRVDVQVIALSGTIIPAGTGFTDQLQSRILYSDEDTEINLTNDIVAVYTEEVAPIYVPANFVVQMTSLVPGVSSVSNDLEGVVGEFPETDPELSARRDTIVYDKKISVLEKTTIEIFEVPDVSFVRTYQSNATSTDLPWVPVYTQMTVVEGGDPNDIAGIIHNNRQVCVETSGNNTVVYTDAAGDVYNVLFRRPDYIDIIIEIDVTITDPTIYPGFEYVQKSVYDFCRFGHATRAARYNVGDDIIWSQIFAGINVIQGFSVSSMNIARIGETLEPTTISITPYELAVFTLDNITVNET